MKYSTKLADTEPFYIIPIIAIDWRDGFGIAFKWMRFGVGVWFV